LDTRKRHSQPAWYQHDNVSAIQFDKCKNWTGFVDDNGFAYFCRNKSRSSRRLILKVDENSV